MRQGRARRHVPGDHEGPYHLINTNVVLLDGKLSRYRSAAATPSPLATVSAGRGDGIRPTAEWTPRRNLLPIRAVAAHPAEAMAISAAAVTRTPAGRQRHDSSCDRLGAAHHPQSPLGCGLPSRGTIAWRERGPALSAQLPVSRPDAGPARLRPERACDWIELTDGGHFDNTGIYESPGGA